MMPMVTGAKCTHGGPVAGGFSTNERNVLNAGAAWNDRRLTTGCVCWMQLIAV